MTAREKILNAFWASQQSGHSPGEQHVTCAQVLLEILATSDGPIAHGAAGKLLLANGGDLVPQSLRDVGDV
jgi:hypothetical protein